MHRLLTKSQRTGFVSDGSSLYRMMLYVLGARSGGFWTLPVFFVEMPGSWFQDLQAVWQPLQPMQISGVTRIAFRSFLFGVVAMVHRPMPSGR
jgi:hypothetical protein